MILRIYLLLVIVALLLAVAKCAEAHSWYPQECCHDVDCHPVGCETLAENADGSVAYTDDIRHVTFVFEKHKVKASLDGKCHVCIHSSPFNVPVTPMCVFIQQSY